MKYKLYKKLSKEALGKLKADIVLKNVNLVNVISEEIIKTDLAIGDGYIIGFGEYSGKQEIDLSGKYVCPGFINAHLHMESTMVRPTELLKHTIKSGTTTYIADPHEAANVCGIKGIDFMLDQTENVPANVYFMAPSCVPAAEIEESGATLLAEDLAVYANNKRVLGIGEVMNLTAVIKPDKDMHEKMKVFKKKYLDGHAPGFDDKLLATYVLSGISTDHEACTYEYAMQEIRNGVQVHIREGSAAHNLDDIVRGIVENNPPIDKFSFCTDDKHIEDIRKEGEISYNVKRSIQLGLEPIKAIKMATINAANCYGLKHLGALTPGRQADFLILNDIKTIDIEAVYHKGVMVCNKQKDVEIIAPKYSKVLNNTVSAAELMDNIFEVKNNGEVFPVIQMQDKQITTKRLNVKIPNKGGIFTADKKFNKIAIIERHKASGKTGVGVICGFNIKNGAIATSVAHDSHNILVCGDNDKDMLIAAKELIRTNGGYSIASNGGILNSLPLPLMGLMSDVNFEEVQAKLKEMLKTAAELGVNENMDPFITLSFMALSVIPEIRITPRGVYDVLEMVIV